MVLGLSPAKGSLCCVLDPSAVWAQRVQTSPSLQLVVEMPTKAGHTVFLLVDTVWGIPLVLFFIFPASAGTMRGFSFFEGWEKAATCGKSGGGGERKQSVCLSWLSKMAPAWGSPMWGQLTTVTGGSRTHL